MKTYLSRMATLIMALLTTGLFLQFEGCSSDGEQPSLIGPSGNGDSLVTVAGDLLAIKIDSAINVTLSNPDSTLRPNDIDFTPVLVLYEQALAQNPNNQSALFGASFSGLMTFLADPGLNDLYERFKNLNDAGGFFPVAPLNQLPEIGLGGSVGVVGLPVHPSAFTKLMFDFSKTDVLMTQAGLADPTITEIQYVIETSLLPRVLTAQTRMISLLSIDTSFKFIITPEMQGNLGADTVIVDLADFRAILASLYASEAGLHIFLARSFDLSSYTAGGVEQALQQSSSFLSLRGTGGNVGRNHMAAAKLDILSAESQLELAIDGLLDEISSGASQTQGLIKVFPGDEVELLRIKDSLMFYRTYFNGPKDLLITWRTFDSCVFVPNLGFECYFHHDTILTSVDISQFFDNPVNNYKEVLPAYTLTISADSSYYQQFAQDHFDRQAYWDNLLSIYGVTSDTAATLQQYGFSSPMPDADTDAFYTWLANQWQSQFGWDDFAFLGGDPLYVWNYSSNNRFDYSNLWYNRFDWVICYAWQDIGYDNWTWPNPNFNGLLPGMTSDRIKSDIIDVIDLGTWLQSDCNTLNVQ